jgi:hypothetical protein
MDEGWAATRPRGSEKVWSPKGVLIGHPDHLG